ncbi:MAG: NTP transferase domain-containing protein [Prevotella sp.]|nr:NTP transferase domain-containing protein [Prevotella sp.]
MKFAIIAAGEGSRLTDEGVLQPKPLVQLGGECLIDRLLRIFMDNGATEIAVTCKRPKASTASSVARYLTSKNCSSLTNARN